ncbi:MAG: YidC/Oxa1 family membrane protein insertase [Anaerolineae bacterium]|nr:YidC/Oxa1 family membrane protein insertase [Anaerolineae bacterium]
MFDFIAYPLANLILLLYTFLGQNTVIAIAVLTLIINMAMLPLNLSQQRSARKMQELQPEIEKLKKKYGKDQERLSQETMKLYKEKGINPMGGCLPLLIQMPIWFGLLAAIRYCIPSTPLDLFQFSQHIGELLPGLTISIPAIIGIVPLQSTFLGMDLGLPPSMAQWWSYSLPLLVGLTSWLQQKLLSPSTPSSPASSDSPPSQTEMMSKQMQIMMPLMFMMFTLSYATGLSIYFIISSLIRIAQYYLIRDGRQEESTTSKPTLAKQK